MKKSPTAAANQEKRIRALEDTVRYLYHELDKMRLRANLEYGLIFLILAAIISFAIIALMRAE